MRDFLYKYKERDTITKNIETMNITREQRDGGVSIVKVVVGEADYGQAVEKQ